MNLTKVSKKVLDPKQFRELIVDPTLDDLGLYSAEASELLLGTALQESHLTYVKQLGSGPALGVFQMEPDTYYDIWENWLRYRTRLATKVRIIAGAPRIPSPELMISNLRFATAMCRIHYRRVPEALPQRGDVWGQAHYWKKHYNTELGRGTVNEYKRNWEKRDG